MARSATRIRFRWICSCGEKGMFHVVEDTARMLGEVHAGMKCNVYVQRFGDE